MSRSDEQHGQHGQHRCIGGGIGGGIGGVTGGGPGDGHEHGVSCREISEFLLAYLEADLEPEARAEFDRHLNHCPPCLHYLDGYRETIELVRACARGADPALGSASGFTSGFTSGLGPQFGDACVEAERAKHKPPEGLIQAILAAKRSLES